MIKNGFTPFLFYMRYFLPSNPISRLFDHFQDYKALIGNGSRVFTRETCGNETFSDFAELNQVKVKYELKEKFKNAALLNFVNIFGDKVIKKTGDAEPSSFFLRNIDREVKTIYVDRMK